MRKRKPRKFIFLSRLDPKDVMKSRMEMADIVTSLPKDGCRLKGCSKCGGTGLRAEAGPKLFGGVVVGVVRGSVAKVHHSRRAGSSGTNEMMICRLLMLMVCSVVVIGWLSSGVPIRIHVTGCRGTIPRTANHLKPGQAQARLPLSHMYSASVRFAGPARACRGQRWRGRL